MATLNISDSLYRRLQHLAKLRKSDIAREVEAILERHLPLKEPLSPDGRLRLLHHIDSHRIRLGVPITDKDISLYKSAGRA